MSSNMFRQISPAEIQVLSSLDNRAEDWRKVTVADPFHPERIRNVYFGGAVSIGVLGGHVSLAGGLRRPIGLYNSAIYDCALGDNVHISDVPKLVNYDIGSKAVVENVGSLVCEGETRFGNGVEIDVLNEAGGRTLQIFDCLSAQVAYLLVFYRHDRPFIEKLSALIEQYIAGKRSHRGQVRQSTYIRNTSAIVNCSVGPHVVVDGAQHLQEGTIVGCEQAPTTVGQGVIARQFIVLSGTKVDGSCHLDKCFIGQGVSVGKQYSAENSLLFANTEAFHGEAVSIFAGPFTVTHHKSTLLIAGLFSFYNAGSGSNQSNHMYKLGPVHQGILERGSKTSSASYLLWPCRVGAFTAVVGKHYSNFDTSNLPFSYISEEDGKSVLTPAMNLLTVGTRRDAEKWPARDQRKDPRQHDLIHFNLLSPYTVSRMARGQELLLELQGNASKTQEFVTHGGVHIRRLMLKMCSRYYEMGIRIFLGDCLSARFDGVSDRASHHEILKVLTPTAPDTAKQARTEWIDVAGMLCPRGSIDELTSQVSEGTHSDLRGVIECLRHIHADYREHEWAWCLGLMERRLGVALPDMGRAHFEAIIDDWEKSKIRLNNMISADAQKEFHAPARIGYGIDGGDVEQQQDFEAVRGTYEDNKFVRQLQEDTNDVQRRAVELRALVAILPACDS